MHRGCGLARPCTGQAIMGSGGGKWQRLRLLRAGRHPKSKVWLGSPLPEAAWSLATVSSVSIALTETRKRDHFVACKAVCPQGSAKEASRLELVKQRVRAKMAAGAESKVVENKIALSSHPKTCVGEPAPVISRRKAMRLRVRSKEAMALGERHV